MTDPGLASNSPARVESFVGLFATQPSEALIANLSTRVEALNCAGLTFPLTVNDGQPTCYICHPTTGYIDYAIEETRNFAANPVLRATLTALIRAGRPLIRATGMDRQVQINNWLLSTNPVPRLDPPAARALRDELTRRFPGHAPMLRSLNRVADAPTMEALLQAGFRLVPSRQVYLFTTPVPGEKASNDLRRDRVLLAKTSLTRVGNDGFLDADYPRAAELYADLYLRKYTPLNPAYTAAFLRGMHRAGLLELHGLRDPAGQLVAVTGLFTSGRTLTQPVVGYDRARPVKEGLYRMMMQIARDEAEARGLFFNCSAGAAGFKRLRGGRPVIEYSAVYLRHLPLRRRMAAGLVAALLTRIGVPLLERFEL